MRLSRNLGIVFLTGFLILIIVCTYELVAETFGPGYSWNLVYAIVVLVLLSFFFLRRIRESVD